MDDTNQTLVIGLGNIFRRDDGAGRFVARRIATETISDVGVIESSGEGASLMDAWLNAENVVLIDAVDSGAAPGTIHRLDAQAAPLPGSFFHYSTHAFSLAEAVELARVLDQLPRRLIVYGIEGKDFTSGEGLSPEVALAVEEVICRVRGELCTKCP